MKTGTRPALTLAMLDLTSSAPRLSLDKLHVLVSGGTTGIGRAIALKLAEAGARVFIFGRHEKELKDALSAGRDCKGTLEGMTADQSDPAQVEKVFAEVDRRFPRLDVMVNNAAIGGDDLLAETDAEIEMQVKTNLCGYLYCARQALLRMKRRKAGHLINIGSISAENLKAGGEIYTATKSANRAFSESIRKSVQDCGIKVTLVEPGKTGSDMIELPDEEKREQQAVLEMMKAEDVAEAVCFCLTLPRRAVITSLQIEPFRHQ
ncbi:MAG TPA: SDR family oxidoreductase [Verrucomicrobiales bacterium]|jgi:NADP-dependent 3-hydroxy acid dehydrogenase YdfG|nr:SDR family oxidoreductase [Verrucomicrobiales bacterium]